MVPITAAPMMMMISSSIGIPADVAMADMSMIGMTMRAAIMMIITVGYRPMMVKGARDPLDLGWSG
jgi:hypothetical protein